jgi:hypothetical protein
VDQLTALLKTLVLESLVVLAVLRALGWAPDRRWPSLVAAACAASLLTHPFAWTLVVELRGWAPGFWWRAVPVELGLTVAEGLFYVWMLRLRWWQGLLLSVLANGLSFGVGVLL